ncbi:MAG: ABC transporter permease [Saprospiraceae bacterium]|nr:ABC transporter permease [Saprospiraceae bacterium]
MSKEIRLQNEILIKPKSPFSLGFAELWHFRELLYFFSWKDIKVRYKQAFLGVLWTIIQPLTMMGIFIVFLTKGLGLSTAGMPPPLYFLSGLLLWQLFNQSVSNASHSMVQNAGIIKKIYFPRLILPSSGIMTASFDFIISVLLFLIVCIYYQISGSLNISWANLILSVGCAYLITTFFSFGLGTLLSALNVKYRDIRYALPFLIQAIFFITPVMYSSNTIENPIVKNILLMNPLSFGIEMIRSNISSSSLVIPIISMTSLILLTLLYFFGIFIFRKTEAYFADIV